MPKPGYRIWISPSIHAGSREPKSFEGPRHLCAYEYDLTVSIPGRRSGLFFMVAFPSLPTRSSPPALSVPRLLSYSPSRSVPLLLLPPDCSHVFPCLLVLLLLPLPNRFHHARGSLVLVPHPSLSRRWATYIIAIVITNYSGQITPCGLVFT